MLHGAMCPIMGTRFDIILIHPDRTSADRTWQAIADELESLEKMLNRFQPQSEVARVNEQLSLCQTAPVSNELWEMLLLCRQYHERTLGLFDITLHDFSSITFHGDHHISSLSPSISLDFGGFAKGYALKKIKEKILKENIKHAFIDFGNSSIIGIGHHPYGNCWKVCFPNPYNQTPLAEYELHDKALSTSGNAPQYTGHIINPFTGVYNERQQASTVLSDDPLDAEVLSTVWMIADERQREEIANNFPDITGTIYTL